MRKKASPWLVAAAAFLISTGAAGPKTVHADEIVHQEETVEAVSAVEEKTGKSDDADIPDSTEAVEASEDEEATEEAESVEADGVSEDAEAEGESEDIEVGDNSEVSDADMIDEEGISDTAENPKDEVLKDNTDGVAEDTAEDEISENVSDNPVSEEDTDESTESAESGSVDASEKTEKAELSSDTDAAKADAVKADIDVAKTDAGKTSMKSDKDEEVNAVITNDESKMYTPNSWVQFGDKWRYYTGTNTYYKNAIVSLGGYTYIFDSDGYMLTGWINKLGNDYFADNSGHLQQGWVKQGGLYFYFGDSVKNSDGTYKVSGYVMKKDGIAEVEGTSYYFAKSGVMAVGWAKTDGGEWLHSNKNGKLDQGWVVLDKNDYHFGQTQKESDGSYTLKGYNMCTYLEDIRGSYYYFGESGVMKKGWIDVYGDKSEYYYANPSGRLAQAWTNIDGKWYHFGYDYQSGDGSWVDDGVLMNSDAVYYVRSKPYYFAKSGVMQTGWIKRTYELTPGEYRTEWYYADKNGILKEGWTDIGGKTYFFGEPYINSLGKLDTMGWDMKSGVVTAGKYGYYFTKDGALVSRNGWIEEKHEINGLPVEGSSWYYVIKDGILANGWRQIGGKWYYFGTPESETPDYMLQSEKYINVDGKNYYVDKNGVLQTGFFDIRSIKNDYICYADSNGEIKDGWLQINGTWYYSKEGRLVQGIGKIGSLYYCFGERGNMRTGWVQSSPGTWHYFEKTGQAAKGWKTIEGKKYYFEEDGYMNWGRTKTDKGVYYFDENGALVTGKSGWIKGYSRYYGKDNPEDLYLNNDGTVVTAPISNGSGGIYAISDNGELIKNGIVDLYNNGSYYLADENGLIVKTPGWTKKKVKSFDYLAGEEYYEDVWFYIKSDGTVAHEEIININGTKYGFSNDGYMLKETVAKLYDPVMEKNRYAAFNSEGKEITQAGWNKVADKWCFFIGGGQMVRDQIITVDGHDYAFDYDGVLVTDKAFLHGSYCYKADKSGIVSQAKGWTLINEAFPWGNVVTYWVYVGDDGKYLRNEWIGDYYLDGYGRMATGVTFDPVKYDLFVFGQNGKLVKGGWTAGIFGTKFYANKDGTAYNGKITENGKTYYIFDGMVDYVFEISGDGNYVTDSDGAVHTTPGFFTRTFYEGNESYDELCYVDKTGHCPDTGWFTVDGNTYYMRSGSLLTGTQFIYNERFVFDSQGRLISK